MRRPRVSATILRHLVSFRDRLWLAACIICLSGFVAVCFTALIAARWETDRRADSLAVTTAATAADAIGRMIDQADVAIRGTIEHLAIAQAAAPDEPLHSTVLFGHASSGGLLEFIDVMNEDSYVTEALQPSERGIRWLGRDYFIAQKNNASLGLFISRPFGRDQAIGVALSRRLSHPDGTFAGVVVAGLRLIQVRDLLARIPVGPNGSIELLRNDGVVLMRVPFDQDAIGRIGVPGATDSAVRHAAVHFIGDLPLFVSVTVANADVSGGVQRWIMAVLVAGIVVGGCCLVLIVGWQREARRRATAERQSRRKSDYLAMASHDLRLPLHGIIAHTEHLRAGVAIDAAADRHLAGIEEATSHLQCVIGRLLDCLQVAPRLPTPRMRLVDLNELIDQCCILVESDAAVHGLGIRYGFKVGVPGQFVTDPDLLKQILLNLLSNAIKFTDRGEVAIEVGGTAERITIEVVDTGCGIVPSRRYKLFRQGDPPGSDMATPTSDGIGLAMSQRLVQSLGGDIGFRENPAGGSIFWIGLPAGRLAALPISLEHAMLAG